MGSSYGKKAVEMVRALHRLSNLKVERAKQPGMYADGGGLYLRVAEGGSKQWIYRYTTNGHNRDMGLGPLRLLTLAEARERARAAGKLRLDGIDPIAHKRGQRSAAIVAAAGAKTFKECAEGFIRDNEKKWTHPKHRRDWERTLVRFVFPTLGNLPVASIDTPLVLKVMKPLWERVPETASRVRGRIEAVLGWATVHHYRTGDNPARWRQHLEHALPSRSEIAKIEHHAALPYAQAASFMDALRRDTSIAARALEFITLTAARLGEAIGATWEEIDLGALTWTIPAERMKADKEHKVPLSDAVTAVLKAMHEIRQSAYVFPGFKSGQPIGGDALRELIKKLAGNDVTVHGLRSTFRDWAAECTAFPREVAEMALAHAIPDAVEAAYRRGDLFDKRRKLMDAWAAYCAKIEMDAGKVVALARAQTPR
jgi:integrase